MKKINLPLSKHDISTLKAGDCVLLNGKMFTARDAGHKRLVDMIKQNKPLPIDLENASVYYAGPCPNKPGQTIGSCGPTTSGRCDSYTPALLQSGLTAMTGKGWRNDKVKQEIKKQGAVYFAAIGGAGALYADCVKKADLIAFEDLGAEALYMLTVTDFPAIVAIDSHGNDIYENR